jgi:succinate dehydrogenase / fumarate reductase, cytochrome b subunit
VSNLRNTAVGYLGYRGREGHWSFLLHRFTGLGVLLFLAVHIVDTSFVFFSPDLYIHMIEQIYRAPLFQLGEIVLVFCVIFHGVNGLRIAFFDLFAKRAWLIPYQRRSALITFVVSMLLWIPAAVIMFRSMLIHNFGLFS